MYIICFYLRLTPYSCAIMPYCLCVCANDLYAFTYVTVCTLQSRACTSMNTHFCIDFRHVYAYVYVHALQVYVCTHVFIYVFISLTPRMVLYIYIYILYF
jgi:hypothetical protein